MSTSLPEILLGMLPAGGGWVLHEELVRRARRRGLGTLDVGSALTTLCAARQAVSETRGGYHFVRRLQAGEQPIVSRPAQARRHEGQAR